MLRNLFGMNKEDALKMKSIERKYNADTLTETEAFLYKEYLKIKQNRGLDRAMTALAVAAIGIAVMLGIRELGKPKQKNDESKEAMPGETKAFLQNKHMLDQAFPYPGARMNVSSPIVS